jgi:hypothetical protein
MLARIAMCVAATLGAGLLAAQTITDFEQTVSRDRIHAYQIEVDHGSTSQHIDVATWFATSSESGLVVTMYDLDGLAQLSQFAKRNSVQGPGAITTTWRLPERSGTHQMMITVECANNSSSSDYVGTMNVWKGTLKRKGFQSRGDFTGSRVWFGRIAQFAGSYRGKGVLKMDFVLDFGKTAHATTFAVAVDASAVIEHRLIDLKSGLTVNYRTTPQDYPVIQDSYTCTTEPYAGRVKFRLEITRSGHEGWGTHSVAIGPDVDIEGLSNPWKKEDDSGDCSARERSNHWPAAALSAPMAWAIIRRRRKERGRPARIVRTRGPRSGADALNVRPGC